MKTASTALNGLLMTGQFVMADLYTFTPKSGSVLRYTSADKNITYGANTWLSTGPLFKRGRTRTVIGVEVDTLDITVYAGVSHLLNGKPFIARVLKGDLDGAEVLLERAFMADWASPVTGTLVQFTGRLSVAQGSRTELRLKVKSDLEILNTPMPRNIYQATCMHTVYDVNCLANKAAVTVTGSVSSTGTSRLQLQSALGHFFWYFNKGTLTCTSGQNNGQKRTVRTFESGLFKFANPLPFVPQAGDTFSVFPGCYNTVQDCIDKFNNKIHFKGTDRIPVPETAF